MGPTTASRTLPGPGALLAALLFVVLRAPPASGQEAAVWRLLGVSPDGERIAAQRIRLDPLLGFHRHALVLLRLGDGAVERATPFVPAARHDALRDRGDYDLLRWEREAVRAERLERLVAEGWRSCRPLALVPLAPPRDDSGPGRAHSGPAHGGPADSGIALPSPAVRVTLPDGPRLVLVEPGVDEDRVVFRDPALAPAADLVLGAVPVRVERVGPFDAVRHPLAGVRDVFACGALDDPLHLVALVETIDPPHAELPSSQHLVAGGRLLAAQAPAADTAPPPAEEAP